jgi:hypothetical protein
VNKSIQIKCCRDQVCDYQKWSILDLGQGTNMVFFEVVNTDCPVTLLTEGLTLWFAAFKRANLADVTPGNNVVTDISITDLDMTRCGQVATCADTAFSLFFWGPKNRTHNFSLEGKVGLSLTPPHSLSDPDGWISRSESAITKPRH